MIDNKYFNKYLHKLLVKPYSEDLIAEDLLKINKIVLNGYNDDEKINYNYSDFKYLTNLQSCSLEFIDVTDELAKEISKLELLKRIEFGFCKTFLTNQFQNNFESIVLNSTDFNILKMLKNKEKIKNIRLISIEELNAEGLLEFINVENLEIYNSKVLNVSEILKLKNIKSLKLDGSILDDEKMLIAYLPQNIEYSKKTFFDYEM